MPLPLSEQACQVHKTKQRGRDSQVVDMGTRVDHIRVGRFLLRGIGSNLDHTLTFKITS